MLIRIAALLPVVALLVGTVQAQEPVFGQGVMATKCGQLIADIPEGTNVGRHPLAFAMLSWTEGYITSLNMQLDEQGEDGFDMASLTGAEIWASIYGYCSRNPDDVGVGAAIDVTSKLERRPF